MIKIPPYLKPGDTIAITCPAGYMPPEKARSCIHTLQDWGYQVMVGKTLGSSSENYFSGTDEERTDELQAMLDDKNIHAILCARGGYGMSRIIDALDFKKFKKRPKWIIGFSDITVMHSHLINRHHIASLHAPMAAAFNDTKTDNDYIQSLYRALAGNKNTYHCLPHQFNRTGDVSGTLIGGNLSLIAHLTGTVSDIDSKNKILFLEDIGEYLYNLDRMLYQLKRSGKFNTLKGLIIGGFTGMKDTERPFGKTTEEVIKEIIQEFDFPVCFNFPVSHEKENVALKIGCSYRLKITSKKVVLKEI